MLALFVAAAAFGFTACGDDSESPTSPSGSSGTFRLMLKDSPYTDAKSVLVTFSEVTAHRESEAEFTPVPFANSATSRTCDLKKLQTAQDVLGVGALPAGRYTMVRLVVSSAALYFDNAASGDACAATIAAPAGQSAPLEIPSGEVKLNRPFDVSGTGTTTMLLDFDGDRSIRETGNGRFMMTPVITVESVQ
jgi:hypothetical protein